MFELTLLLNKHPHKITEPQILKKQLKYFIATDSHSLEASTSSLPADSSQTPVDDWPRFKKSKWRLQKLPKTNKILVPTYKYTSVALIYFEVQQALCFTNNCCAATFSVKLNLLPPDWLR
jgi:hypothetical protein